VIINPVMCVFCVKVYCVAKFCSLFPGNRREAERNKTDRVTIKTIFLKNNIGERGEVARERRPILVLFPFGQTTAINQLIFIDFFRKTNGRKWIITYDSCSRKGI